MTIKTWESRLAYPHSNSREQTENAMRSEIADLRKALADEQAQAVEPVAWMYDWEPDEEVVTDWLTTDYDEAHSPTMGHRNIRPLYFHPATPPAGEHVPEAAFGNIERAELIHWLRERSMWDGMIRLIDAANMLESDVSLINEGNKAQQVAVPVPLTDEQIKEITSDNSLDTIHAVVRAIEAHHKIGAKK